MNDLLLDAVHVRRFDRRQLARRPPLGGGGQVIAIPIIVEGDIPPQRIANGAQGGTVSEHPHTARPFTIIPVSMVMAPPLVPIMAVGSRQPLTLL